MGAGILAAQARDSSIICLEALHNCVFWATFNAYTHSRLSRPFSEASYTLGYALVELLFKLSSLLRTRLIIGVK